MIGVDIFFVLSGFLITTILRDELGRTGEIAFGRFFYNRALRLWPPLLMMLAAYAALAPSILPDAEVLRDVLLAGLYLSDYAVAFWDVPDYLGHTWSLAVEEHFYMIWPFVILVVGRIAGWKLAALLGLGFLAASGWRIFDLATGTDWRQIYFRFDTRGRTHRVARTASAGSANKVILIYAAFSWSASMLCSGSAERAKRSPPPVLQSCWRRSHTTSLRRLGEQDGEDRLGADDDRPPLIPPPVEASAEGAEIGEVLMV